jgi:hypothetical protein
MIYELKEKGYEKVRPLFQGLNYHLVIFSFDNFLVQGWFNLDQYKMKMCPGRTADSICFKHLSSGKTIHFNIPNADEPEPNKAKGGPLM